MEILLIIKSTLIILGIILLTFTLKSFFFPSINSNNIYLARQAHNVAVNNSFHMETSSASIEHTDGLGVSHIELKQKYKKFSFMRFFKRLFVSSTTKVNAIGGQSRPHGLGWNS